MRIPFEMHRSFRFAVVAALLAASLLASGASPAAERNRDPKRARTLVILRIAEALDLDEEQTLRLGSEYRRFDKRRHELLGERSSTAAQLETALGREPVDEAEVRRLTDQLLAIDKELVLMPDALFESVQDMLDSEQRARLALLKIRLQQKIARERSRREGHHPAAKARRDEAVGGEGRR